MGKGDQKTKKGKIAIGSYGVSRPKKGNKKSATTSTKKAAPKSKPKAKPKAKAKKAE